MYSKEKRMDALGRVAMYVVDCENNEYQNYLEYCRGNEHDPENVTGEFQSNHIYALSLIGLGLKFPGVDE